MVRRVFLFLTLILLFIFVPTLNNQAALPPITILYSVNSDQDYTDANIGDGFCDTGSGTGNVCTLRAAIQEANRDNMPSLIKFAYQMSINYPTLEALSEADTTIDGGDQWDGTWPFGRPGVKIGAGGYTSGLLVVTGDNIKIFALEFNGGGNTGISVNSGNGTQIGGLGTNQRNVFRVVSSNSTGVNIGSATDVSIVGNYFGTFDGITAETVDGEYGIYLTGSGVTISDNVIGGQSITGIQSWMGGGHAISNNIIGLDKNRDHSLPNGIGIIIEQSDGSTIGSFNTISGNSSHGIYLHLADQNHLTGNDIGYSEPNGGDGIRLQGSHQNMISAPPSGKILNNGGNGITMMFSDENVVRGQDILGNSGSGIYTQDGQNNIIGGTGLFDSNEISSNSLNGVHLDSGADSNDILGNFIGYDSGAFDEGNLNHGILISNGASNNHVGGLDPGMGNYIGWNDQTGIMITGSGTNGNVVDGNIVGAPVGWAFEAPNGNHGIGIYNGAYDNWVGINNTILASGWSGVVIVNANLNKVWSNNIGTDGADNTWGNYFYGVNVVNGEGNQIYNNKIANNGKNGSQAGIRVDGATAVNNFISVNSIFDNGTLGIELINGGNGSLAAPTINSGGCTTAVTGTACPGCLVEIFSDGADEGKYYEGSVTADGTTGAFTWSGTPMGPNLTATASAGLFLSTSQFSAPYAIGVCNYAPTASFTATPTNPVMCSEVTFNATGSSDPEDLDSSLQVRWDWHNDGVYETDWSTEKVIAHTVMKYGHHVIRMQVRDSYGALDATTRQITVSGYSCLYTYLPLVIK